MMKIVFRAFIALCFLLVLSCATGRYVVSYGTFMNPHEVEWDWEYEPPMFSVLLKADAGSIDVVDPERYQFIVTASNGDIIPSETIYNEDGLPKIDARGTYLRWTENVFVRLEEMPPDAAFPIRLQIMLGKTIIETFNVKLR
jgi:hypothetical protein